MTDDVYNKCLAIIQATNDGSSLLPWQLQLVENAINGALRPEGLDLLDHLASRVSDQNWRSFSRADALIFLGKQGVPVS